MTKIDIFSGFLGAGKTTLIKKLISEAYAGEKLVLIENEFGDIGIDGGFLQDAGINITEMNSGCICCSLVGDFGEALRKVLRDYTPDRVVIEPSGVGKLSDVIRAVQDVKADVTLNAIAAVVDVNKCKMYMKNFGEFFNNQVESANTIILSHTGKTSDSKLTACVELLRSHNDHADILTTPWEQLTGAQILELLEKKNTLKAELEQLAGEVKHHHHHHDEDGGCEHEHHHHHHHDEDCEHEHHHHHHDENCDCEHEHHHHHHDEDCGCEHEHHHHHHDEDCDCEHEHHHHHHDEHCDCGHDHHHHHADEVFTSFGAETGRRYTAEEIANALSALEDEEKYGIILRAKGIVNGTDGFIHFDYVPGEPDVRSGSAAPTGRICVIGAEINEAAIKELFKL
ncbi:MAG: GTP-binding protein [Oscillospiraceae bacterium]|nr:GTP-binding protein [Oscillospiraceae bacterium]